MGVEPAVFQSVRKNAQPQIENLCSKGAWGDFPQQARGAIWIATGIACQFHQSQQQILLNSKGPM